jgi:hypothetical protein
MKYLLRCFAWQLLLDSLMTEALSNLRIIYDVQTNRRIQRVALGPSIVFYG